MKCIFIGSIRAKTEYKEAYTEIVQALQSLDCIVSADHVLGTSQEALNKMSKQDNMAFHKNIMKKLKASDLVMAECSHQSLSVGYLLSFAVEQGKPTVVFYKADAPEPNIFPTLTTSEKLFIVRYEKLEDLKKLVADYLEYAKEQLDTRFNFFVSPAIERYLTWVAKQKKLPRSVFLRKLIEDSIARDKAYKEE